MKTRSFVLFIALAACGGAAKPAPATVATPTGPTANDVNKAPPPVETTAEGADDTEAADEAQSAAIEAEMDAAGARIAELDERRQAEQAAYEAAKPVFVKYCGACHTATGTKTSPKKLEHFDMSSYPFDGAANIDEAISVSLGLRGKKATMPMNKPGSLKGEELQLIVDWAKAYHSNHLDRAEP
jgi:mono/diheme cytochrome c family protein